jgi:hypothetical protein
MLVVLGLGAGWVFLVLYKKYLRIEREHKKESSSEKDSSDTKYSDIK